MNVAMKNVARAAVVAAAVALSACTTTSKQLPAMELPTPTTTHVAGIERWWAQFNDPQLTALIEEALVANLDMHLAVARIDEARANLGVARSTLYPTLDAEVGARRARNSTSTDFVFPGPNTTNLYTAGLRASYEVDLWNRLSSGRDAAQSDLLASRYSAETVRTALAAQVAATYFALRAFDTELQITRDTLGTRNENVKLQKQRFDAGLVGDYEVRLSEAERSFIAALIPAIERSIAQTEAALALLAGRSARDVYTPVIARAGVGVVTAVVPEVPSGLPADLLARRPDIRQAEANLAAANSRIDEARAQYFPSLVLTGRFGSESGQLSNVFSGPATVWAIAGSLLQPIFNGGAIAAQVDGATARSRQAELGYIQSVRSAFRDAHDALSRAQQCTPDIRRSGRASRAADRSTAAFRSALSERLFELYRRARQPAQFARRPAWAGQCAA